MTEKETAFKEPRFKSSGGINGALLRERRREVVSRMLRRGLKPREIANEIGVSLYTVQSDMATLEERWRERSMQSYGVWIAEELQKLDRMEEVLWHDIDAKMEHGKAAHYSIDRMLKIMDRRAKLLGLDEPERVEVVSMSAVETEIQRLEGQLGINSPQEIESGEVVDVVEKTSSDTVEKENTSAD